MALEKEDIRILMAVEQGMKKFKTVPANQVAFFARYKKEETQFHLDKVHKMGLLQRTVGSNRGDSISYILIAEGYDILALHALFAKGIIESIGPPLGRGKESDVYRCLTPEGTQVALKFHRLGQTSFRNVRRLRGFVENRGHISWLYMSRLSARREYEALKKIQDLHLDVNIPIPHSQNRHAIVMSILQGEEINKFEQLNDPDEHFNEIIRQYKLIYSQAHMVHGDLGEFNILIDPDDKILIIDWPQWESWKHPQANELLRRDIENVCDYFSKKYQVQSDPDEIITDIKNLKSK